MLDLLYGPHEERCRAKVKEEYKIRHYFRYMDDMVFLASTKQELQKLITKVVPYMKNNLHLTVKRNWCIFEVDVRGIDFVGYVFRHNGVRLRKGIANTLKRVSLKIKQRVNKGLSINYHLYCAINSMKGWLMHCSSNGLYRKYVAIIEQHIEAYHEMAIVRRKKVCNT